ncbi:hypothetical protein P167DRAFT_197800 [Morchella conica CCBAS932]|uniref:Uncharacterized protein n=1 Tax=Morchella conica CCBAS932 TaxID=1392247 RepID=A0A3N4L5U8_9PEZI|nr:hypothetical protein P167DRAFT_197800 [Morchella conica CCBAS932]
MRFPLGVIILIVVTFYFYSLAVIIELPISVHGGVEWPELEEDLQYLRAFFYNPFFFLTLYLVVARGGDFGLVYVSFPFFFPLPVIKQHASAGPRLILNECQRE